VPKSLIITVILLTIGYVKFLIPSDATTDTVLIKEIFQEDQNVILPSESLHQAMNQVADKMKEHQKSSPSPPQGHAESVPPTPEWSEIENQIDQIEVQPFERAILGAFDSSTYSKMISRITIIRRYHDQVTGAELLEERYLTEMSQNVDHAVVAMADALKNLPKQEYRDEHELIWELAGKLPNGRSKLQNLLPDEEFINE